MTSAEIEAALKDAREGLSVNLRSGNAREAEVMLSVIEGLEKQAFKVALAEKFNRDAKAAASVQCQQAANDAAKHWEDVASRYLACECIALSQSKGLRACPVHGHGLTPYGLKSVAPVCAKAGVKCLREES